MFDAHNHLCDPRLNPFRSRIIKDLNGLGIKGAVVNSAMEEDWEAVSDTAHEFPWVIPAFGLHPWHVDRAEKNWRNHLIERLDAHPNSTIGEIGLDRWIPNHDIALQQEAFVWQLSVAAERNLPVSIHCLKAWGLMLETLQGNPLPECGFLLHAYAGPEEMVKEFAKLGARFSFSPYFLHERKVAQREVFSRIPWERLLVETDAPDLWPPDERNLHPLREQAEVANSTQTASPVRTKPLNHPANIEVAYAGLAEVRGVSLELLAETVSANFKSLFSKQL